MLFTIYLFVNRSKSNWCRTCRTCEGEIEGGLQYEEEAEEVDEPAVVALHPNREISMHAPEMEMKADHNTTAEVVVEEVAGRRGAS